MCYVQQIYRSGAGLQGKNMTLSCSVTLKCPYSTLWQCNYFTLECQYIYSQHHADLQSCSSKIIFACRAQSFLYNTNHQKESDVIIITFAYQSTCGKMWYTVLQDFLQECHRTLLQLMHYFICMVTVTVYRQQFIMYKYLVSKPFNAHIV